MIGVENGWLVAVGSQSCVIWMKVLDSFAGADDDVNDGVDGDENDDEKSG